MSRPRKGEQVTLTGEIPLKEHIIKYELIPPKINSKYITSVRKVKTTLVHARITKLTSQT